MKKQNIIILIAVFSIIISLTTINAQNTTNQDTTNENIDDTLSQNSDLNTQNTLQPTFNTAKSMNTTHKNVKKQYKVSNYQQLYNTIEDIKANSTNINETITLTSGNYEITNTINWGNTTHKTHILNIKCDDIILDGGETHQFITVSNNYTLNLENINVRYCMNLNGSVINNNGTIHIQDSNFIENECGYGGVIYNTGNITIDNSDFTENMGVLGAVSYNTQNANMKITNSKFTLNNAQHFGTVYNNQNATLTVENSIFTQNTAEFSGGVICNNATAKLIINNSTFNENKALYDVAGVCYIKNGNVTIINSRFNQNQAPAWGGAICIKSGNLTIINSNFKENTAGYYGGVINATNSNINITNSNFTNNNATNAGAINAYKTNLTITQSIFNENIAINKTTNTIQLNNTNLTLTQSQLISQNKQNLYISHDSIAILNENNITTITQIKKDVEKTLTLPIMDENSSNVTLKIDNKTYTPTINNDQLQINHTFNTYPQNKQIPVTYPKFSDNNITVTVEIQKENITLDQINPIEAKKYDKINIPLNIHTQDNKTVNENFTVTIKIDDKIYQQNITTKSIILDTYNLTPTQHTLTIIVENPEYNINTVTTALTITPPDIAIILNPIISTHMDLLNEQIIIQNCEDTATVIFKINGNTLKDKNGVQIKTHPKDGIVTLNYQLPTTYKNSEYNLTVVYSKGRIREESTNILILQKRDVTMPKINYEIIKNSTFKINTTIKDTTGKTLTGNTKVSIKINGVTYKTLTITNGKLDTALDTRKLGAKNYTLTIVVGENSQYNTYRYETILSVKQPKINLQPITTTTTTLLKTTIKIDNAQNNGVIIFKINGKTIKDKNGQTIKIQLKNGQATINYQLPATLSAKKYNLTVVYSYENLRIEKTTTLTLNKMNTKIENKTYKTQKNTNLTLKTTIKDANGKTLTGNTKIAIKINGVTYENQKITNGQINTQINTSKLNKGKYIITIISGENNLYNKSTLNTTLMIV